MNNISKWKIGLISGILMNITLGFTFTWSILSERISNYLKYDCSWIYIVSMIGMSISCIIFGYFVDKCTKISSKLCLILYILGLAILIPSIYFNIIPLLVIGDIVFGLSFGFLLLVPVKNILLQFNSNKGMIIGISLTIFSLSRVISSFLISVIFKELDPHKVITIIGFIGLIPLIISTYLIKFLSKIDKEKCKISINDWAKSIIKVINVKKLYVYWTVLFFGIVSGYSLLAYKNSLFETLNLNHKVGLFLILGIIFNIVGRLGTGIWSDKLKNKNKLISLILYISSLVCILGFIWSNFIPITIILCSMLYGALITIMPISLEDCYGLDKVGRSLGFVFSAITIGGIFGYYFSLFLLNLPSIIYQTVLLSFGILYAISLYLSSDLLIKNEDKNNIRLKNP